jgi:hypothetical protein
MKMMVYRILFAALILSLALMAGEAGDYNEGIGPYEVSFKLPDEIASLVVMNKSISSSESLLGIPCDLYSLALNQKDEPVEMGFGKLWIRHYVAPVSGDFVATSELVYGDRPDLSYTTCYSGHRPIDGHYGILVNCLGNSDGSLLHFKFEYQLDNQTTVSGIMRLGWDTGMFPFLESLHVTEA